MAAYFSIILVIVTLTSGLIWLVDSLMFAPKRKERIALAQSSTATEVDEETLKKIAPQPAIVEFSESIFPVIAFVLVLRSFFYEPFQIPSGSMMPTLLVGDFILVEKYSYGVKDPVWRSKFIETGAPERGDIAVFKYPEDERLDYIKRVVGLPGDRIIYQNKTLYIQPACTGQSDCPKLKALTHKEVNRNEFYQGRYPLIRANETLGEVNHDILYNPAFPPQLSDYYRQQGTKVDEWIVPEGHYFMMGDNRDNSRDSRYWGFVSDDQLVGKAVFIWISFEFERDPESFLPGWIPTGVRFNRIGSIQ